MNQTPRQYLIWAAAQVSRQQGVSAIEALNIVGGEGRTVPAGSLGARARAYFLAASDQAFERLIAEVRRQAK